MTPCLHFDLRPRATQISLQPTNLPLHGLAATGSQERAHLPVTATEVWPMDKWKQLLLQAFRTYGNDWVSGLCHKIVSILLYNRFGHPSVSSFPSL